jgi:hypothetical protein
VLSQAQAAELPAELSGRVTGPETAACFARIEARDPAARWIAPIADNATDNRAAVVCEWLARPGCRVRVVDLPPYAPNLNLIERLCWFFKKKTLWNTHDQTLANFRSAIRSFFANLGQWKAGLDPLLTNRFHLIGHKPAQLPAGRSLSHRAAVDRDVRFFAEGRDGDVEQRLAVRTGFRLAELPCRAHVSVLLARAGRPVGPDVARRLPPYSVAPAKPLLRRTARCREDPKRTQGAFFQNKRMLLRNW